jgi:hypothetical protein
MSRHRQRRSQRDRQSNRTLDPIESSETSPATLEAGSTRESGTRIQFEALGIAILVPPPLSWIIARSPRYTLHRARLIIILMGFVSWGGNVFFWTAHRPELHRRREAVEDRSTRENQSVPEEFDGKSASESEAIQTLRGLAPPALTDYPDKRPRATQLGLYGVNYYAADGGHIDLLFERTAESIEPTAGRRMERVEVAGHTGYLDAQGPVIAMVWRVSEFVILTWAYPSPGGRLNRRRVLAANTEITRWAHSQIGNNRLRISSYGDRACSPSPLSRIDPQRRTMNRTFADSAHSSTKGVLTWRAKG